MSKRIKILQQKLWLKIIIAMVLGVVVGFVLQSNLFAEKNALIISSWLAIPGHMFLAVIQMIVIPLIFASIIKGVVASGSLEKLKILGSRLVFYFLMTTTFAIVIGLFLAMVIQPGNYVTTDYQTEKDLTLEEIGEINAETLPESIINIIPTNPLGSMVERDMLAVVIFAIICGLALITMSLKQRKPLLNLMSSIQELCVTIVKWVMLIVPLAVFGLLVEATTTIGFDVLIGMSIYVLTVIIGLIMMVIIYLFIVLLLAKRNPSEFLRDIREVQLLAFSTSSSAAVMPLSMEVAEEKLAVKPGISQFLIPLGTTINMDGTALYQAVATIFLAQVFNVELNIFAIILILITTIGASVGSPGTPGVGIIILGMVLMSVGVPTVGIALILGVDRILDMCRTVVNVTGDLTASVVMNHLLRNKSIFEH